MLEEEYQPRRILPPHLRKPAPAEPPFSYEIRDALISDMPDVREIYNHYVANTVVTLDEKRSSLAKWRTTFARGEKLGLPFLVAVSPSGQILGYAVVTPWSSKRALRFTGEISIYLRAASTGKGLGRALLAELVARSRGAGLRQLMAVIADSAEPSISLHRSAGFAEVGRMGRVGYKFDRWLGTVLMQRSVR